MANIEQVQYIISELALRHNLVNSAFSGPSIYQINPEVVKEYPFIFVSPTGTHVIKENVTRYSFSIFFVDRLLDDSSNENAVFSVAVETLKNLYKQIKELEFVTDVQEEVNVRLFGESEKMNDRCAGGYMELWLEVLNAAACGEWFDEYGNPMGEYFNIEQIENVLDSLASKTWVIQKLQEVGGVTIDDVDREIDRKLRPYATVRYVDEQIAAISSGVTPELSGVTHDIQILSAHTEENAAQITAITAQISILSGFTHESVSSITQSIETLSEAISAATPADYAEVKAQVSANTQDIATLSGYTDALFTDVHDLTTGFTSLEGQITAVTSDFSTLEGQVTANTQNIQTLSATTSALTSQIAGKQNSLTGSNYISVSADTVDVTDLVVTTYATGTINKIRAVTQSWYDDVTVKDPNTLYVIIPSS